MKKIIALLLVINFVFNNCTAQQQRQMVIDSLLLQLPKVVTDTQKISLLNALANNYPYVNPDEGVKCGKEALQLAEKLSWTQGIAAANAAIGGNYANKADYANALKFEYNSLKIYEQLNDRKQQALMFRNIAIVYHTSKNQSKSLQYNVKALKLYQALNDREGIAAIYNNMANVYYSLKDKEKVIENDLNALHIYEELNNASGIARMLGNMANFYAEEGNYSEAMAYYFNALRKENALGNKNGVTRNLGNIGETYLDIAKDTSGKIKTDSLIPEGKAANLRKALFYLETTLTNAKALGQTEYVLAYAEVLSEAYQLEGNSKDALKTYQEYINIRDSVYDVEKYNAATRRELDYEYGKREDSIKFQKRIADVKLVAEKKSRKEETLFFISGLALILIFSIFMFNRWRVTQQQKVIIEKEKKRSDDLLLNILPEEVAEELKSKGEAEAKMINEVTVLFTDFKGFTQLSEKLSAKELVAEIHECFSAFDNIMKKHGVEKIKTIGDAYMAAGGLPVPNQTHATDVVRAALDIQKFMQAHKSKKEAAGKLYFEIRIGVHTGAVVAGIVGIKKYSYDIWGDTVNTASRMESSGEVGKVNISDTTYQLVKDKFNCTPRGKIVAKGKGEIEMYFVEQFPE